MRRLAALMAAGALLAGCATQGRVDTGKALAVAWASLDAASLAATAAVNSGKLHGAPAKTVSDDLKKASAALTVATDAYAGAEQADPVTQIAVATAAVAEITSIVGAAR